MDTGTESKDYLAKRTLKQGTAGWLLLAGLGVGYVISGDYSGWNFGLAEGGFGGLLIAAILIAGMYLAMVLGMAEMSSALPAAGGGYTFARRALGPWGGFATGTAILIEYAIAPAAIATFIGAYVESLGLFGITDGWWVYLAVYVLFIGIHLAGVGEALKVMFVITAIALAGLLIFAISAIGSFDAANLTDIAPTDAAGASSFLPFGYVGIWAAVPFAIWFFLAVEGVPLAAEEAKDPARNVPRGIIAAMGVLLVTATTVLVLVAGSGGAEAMSASGNPLVEALGESTMAKVVNYIGLAGLIASFFSIIFAYSRQLFALSRAGYLPKRLSVVNAPQSTDAGADSARHHRLRSVADRTGRDASQHGGVRRRAVLRLHDVQPHRAAGAGAGHGASVPNTRGHRHHIVRAGGGGPVSGRDVCRRQHGGHLVSGRFRRVHGLLRDLQSPPPGGELARRGIRCARGRGERSRLIREVRPT